MEKLQSQATQLCRHYPDCGGCQTLEMEMGIQLDAKQKYLTEKLKGLGEIEIRPILPSPTAQGYRHKVMLPFGITQVFTNGADEGHISQKITLGCFAKDSHQVIDQSECFVQDADLTRCAHAIREWAQIERISIYNEKKHQGTLRHVLLRKGSGTGQILVGIVINGDEEFKKIQVDSLRARLEAALPSNPSALKGIVLNHNSERTNVTLGEKETLLFGSSYIEETLNDFTFRLRLGSFFQINPFQATQLFDLAVKHLQPGQKILDLYSGAGTFTLWAAKKTGYAEGWEENESAVQSAKEAAQLNHLQDKAHFVRTEVSAQLEIHPGVLETYDGLVVDPPRKGLEATLISALIQHGPPQLVYVSCNPNSLARDLTHLMASYTIESVQPVDMMPHTRHIESVVHLKRKN